jgi:hypothetical protein
MFGAELIMGEKMTWVGYKMLLTATDIKHVYHLLAILLVQQYGEKSSVFGVSPSTVNHGLYTSRHTFN